MKIQFWFAPAITKEKIRKVNSATTEGADEAECLKNLPKEFEGRKIFCYTVLE